MDTATEIFSKERVSGALLDNLERSMKFQRETAAENIAEAANEIRAVRAGLAGLRDSGTDDPRALDGFETILARAVLVLENVTRELAPAIGDAAN